MKNHLVLICLAALVFSSSTYAQVAQRTSALKVASPNGDLTLAVRPDASGHLSYSVTRKGRVVIEPSALGIAVDGQDFAAQAALGKSVCSKTSETYATRGVHSLAVNRSRDCAVAVSGGLAHTAWALELRVFDDGVAWRYRVPGSTARHIDGESTEWKLPAGGTIWYQDNVKRDYESPMRTGAIAEVAAQLKPGVNLMSTALVRLAGAPLYIMMTEANLTAYSDMALALTGPDTFHALFHNNPDGWTNIGEIASPWRATIVTDNLNALVNTDIIHNLCPAPAPELAGADWIKPSRATWHWMVTGRPRLADQRQWIDWTRQLGFGAYVIDDGWNMWSNGDRDAWACMKEVVDYAATQGVRIWAWTNAKELLTADARKAYFQKARAAGVVGLKIDFMKPADSAWVQWYDDTVREMAAAKLLVIFHGCEKPTGRDRTWPNELTREAVRGREGRKQPGLHDTAIPFTRFVQGSADYTPTDFRVDGLRGNSYAHELAQAILYTSPLFVYSGNPPDYLASEAVDIIKAIPPVWDETIVLPASAVGEVAAYARRSGRDWFIGVVNGSNARTIEVDLKFLGQGRFSIDQFADDPARNDGWLHSKAATGAAGKLTIELRADGGYVARIVRLR